MSGRKDLISKEIEQADREILSEKYKTALKKVQLANDINNQQSEELNDIE